MYVYVCMYTTKNRLFLGRNGKQKNKKCTRGQRSGEAGAIATVEGRCSAARFRRRCREFAASQWAAGYEDRREAAFGNGRGHTHEANGQYPGCALTLPLRKMPAKSRPSARSCAVGCRRSRAHPPCRACGNVTENKKKKKPQIPRHLLCVVTYARVMDGLAPFKRPGKFIT